jgi:nucleotide-binding universal stress UspA family protein
MKTLLISTDFSTIATHAAEYGYNLAKQLKANVILCNAVIVPSEIPQAGVVVWPMEEYNVLMEESNKELKSLRSHLENTVAKGGFCPLIKIINETGMLTDIVNVIVADHHVEMVIMGTHGASGLSSLILGNHSRKMIDGTVTPLLLIPPTAKTTQIKKVAFATDFKHPEEDLKAIYDFLPFAKQLNAELLLTHVFNEKNHTPEFQKWLKHSLIDISNKANYPQIYYRMIKNSNTESGLDWLCNHGQVDMLAMVHRRHNFFDNLVNGSHTKKMADKIPVPLMVIPENF